MDRCCSRADRRLDSEAGLRLGEKSLEKDDGWRGLGAAGLSAPSVDVLLVVWNEAELSIP